MALSLATGTGQASNCAAQTPLYPTTASYVVDKDEPGESTLKNVVGTIDQPNVIRFAVSSVTDLFKGTGVLPISGQSTEGLSILIRSKSGGRSTMQRIRCRLSTIRSRPTR